MPNKEELGVPNLFRIGAYTVYFWSNENGEPIHVHVSEGVPQPNATQVWLTRSGQCIVANNNSQIPEARLKKILEVISAQSFLICGRWKTRFAEDEIHFYC